MKLIDLTHTLVNHMPSYQGDTPPKVIQSTHGKITMTNIETSMHIGTHIDAPLHMIPKGKSLLDFPLETFTGSAVVLNAVGQDIIDELDGLNTLKPGTILLIKTNHSQYFNQDKYYQNYPVLSSKLAHQLVEKKIKILGLDSPSPDQSPYEIHDILLKNNILIIENLTNLSQLPVNTPFNLYAFPIKINGEASILRVVANIDNSSEFSS